MGIFHNHILIAALTATFVAQMLKVVLILITERRLAWERLAETGGMPSSHSAAVMALATGVAYKEGLDSTLFAISAVLCVIVMYDATGIRRAAGLHAELLNELVKEFAHIFDDGFQPQALKTLLGHTYPQVAIGAILGVIIGIAFSV